MRSERYHVGHLLLSPLILTTDLILLLRCKVVLNVERLANLLGWLTLDHVGNSLAANIEQGLDVKVVGGLVSVSEGILTNSIFPTYQNNLKKHFLVNLHELLIPLLDICWLLASVGILVGGGGGIVLVVFTPLKDLAEDSVVDLYIFIRKMSIMKSCLRGLWHYSGALEGGNVRTLGIGMAWSISRQSSNMFLMRTERSATSRAMK